MKARFLLQLPLLLVIAFSSRGADPKQLTREFLDQRLPDLQTLYTHLHQNPELSFMETNTAARLAAEWRKSGFEVTEKVGGFGVVAVLKNGGGPTVLLRTDLDALPVKEQTGLPYASAVEQKTSTGEIVPVMHACGHDMHMTAVTGAAAFLANHTNLWSGTLVVIGQPAEEKGGGAKAMLQDGLFHRFPKPDFCLALHVNSKLPAGTLGYVPGFALANVDSVDITLRGVGGHGAYPHYSKDPVVLAAETVLALQTLISREKSPLDPGVLTVGSIHGGSKHNIIPDEVKLQLTLRSYSDAVRTNLISGIRRVVRGLGMAAGLPEDKMPEVKIDENEYTPTMYNDPELTGKWANVLREWLEPSAIVKEEPQMGGEDFGRYGRTEDKIPICMLWLGSVPDARVRRGEFPPIHSATYYPDPEPTIRAGVTALAAGALEVFKRP